jgi:hypothetical protein
MDYTKKKCTEWKISWKKTTTEMERQLLVAAANKRLEENGRV